MNDRYGGSINRFDRCQVYGLPRCRNGNFDVSGDEISATSA
jgi:hypothetical protein